MSLGCSLPGDWLRRCAARVCSVATLERLVDPLVADMQYEYRTALAGGSESPVWVRARGYVAFWCALVQHASRRIVQPAPGTLRPPMWSASLAAFVFFSAVLALRQAQLVRRVAGLEWWVLLLLVPGIAAVTVPTSILFGTTIGLARVRPRWSGPVGPRSWMRPLGALVCMGILAMSVVIAWLPHANQSWRQHVFEAMTGSSAPPIGKGVREHTLHELAAGLPRLRAEGQASELALYETEWHKRLALAASCPVFGLLGLGVSARWRGMGVAAALGTCVVLTFGYFLLLRFCLHQGETGQLAPWLAAWGANALFLGLALILIVASRGGATSSAEADAG